MELKQFLVEAVKTEKILDQDTPVPMDTLESVFMCQVYLSEMADVLKRRIYYGEEADVARWRKNHQALAQLTFDMALNSDKTFEARTAGVDFRLIHANLGMITEVGEFSESAKKIDYMTYESVCRLAPEFEDRFGIDLKAEFAATVQNMLIEIVDHLWYVAVVLLIYNLDIEKGFDQVVAKLRKRMGGEKFDAEKCLNRDLEAEQAAMDNASIAEANRLP